MDFSLNTEQKQNSLTDEMKDNSLVIMADCNGAKFLAKLRGCTCEEAGAMFGAAMSVIHGHSLLVLENFRKSYGDAAASEFESGIKLGRDKQTRQAVGCREIPL